MAGAPLLESEAGPDLGQLAEAMATGFAALQNAINLLRKQLED